MFGFGRPVTASQHVDAGGSSAPEWVPANAKIYIDLVNDRAWTEADGDVAIDTLLGADANTENGWAVSEYDPSKLTADGYLEGTDGLVVGLIGAARSKILDAATLTIQFKEVADPYDGSLSFAVVSADGNDGLNINADASSKQIDGGSYNGEASATIATSVNSGVAGALNTVAVTVTGTRFEFTINGFDAQALTLEDADRPAGNPLVATLIDLGSSGVNALQSITIYDALPSTTGLSVLSQTGDALPDAPSGYAYIVNGAGAYILNGDDAYILAKV
jgi:hypothetical protein